MAKKTSTPQGNGEGQPLVELALKCVFSALTCLVIVLVILAKVIG